MRATEFIVETAMMGKIADSGKIIRILKKAHTVPFSDEKNWLLVDTDPGKGNSGLGIKWIPADTRFEWVRPYKDTVDENLSPQTIHKLADRKGVKWDNEPSFLQLTKRLTGKEHLDDLDHSGLNKVKRHLDGLQGVAEEMQHKKITELFDAKTSFPLKWDTQFASSGEVHAEAYDADGRIIDISFTPTGYGSGIEIVFKRGGSYDMTGHGDAPRVLATVVNAISQYLQKYQPPYIAFSAKSTGGRAGAYAAMIRRLARGYKLLTPDEYPDDTTGFLDFLGSDKPFILARS